MDNKSKREDGILNLYPITCYLLPVFILNRSTNGSDNLCIPEMEHIDSLLRA
jgi:hypothetical protein